MDWERLDPVLLAALDGALGYLNLANGSEDMAFMRSLNAISLGLDTADDLAQRIALPQRIAELQDQKEEASWRYVVRLLELRLDYLQRSQPAFHACQQAIAVLGLMSEFVAEYRQFHHVILQHLSETDMMNSFMLGRFFEAILRQGGPWTEKHRILQGAVSQVNDFVGHRPVPNLEGHTAQPYAHEFSRPVPIFIRGVGAACGPYQKLVDQVIAILTATNDQILNLVQFDPSELRELAFDPRSYDFDHPVHRRPGYQFGEWDPHAISESKHYYRFVIRKEMLDIVQQYVEQSSNPVERTERELEAAAVTVGSLLVAAGVSGRGPEGHDSNTTFGTLIPNLGRCRDAFYVNMLNRVSGDHATRLRTQSAKDGQPFNAVRQHLNASLARRNAVQKVRLKLAEVFAQMGYPDVAQRQLQAVPVASARVRGDIACLLIRVRDATEANQLATAQEGLQEIVRRLREGIECGTIVDPRNMLGFDCQFSLFPAIENSVFDHRFETLLEIVHEIFRLTARVWSEAAAGNNSACAAETERELRTFAEWWHTFAAHEVQSIDGESAMLRLVAAQNVAEVVRQWVQSGSASGNVAFWAPHAETFQSPQAYVQVIDVLLKHQDHVASMGLLMHWLGNEAVALERSEASFGQLAHQWLSDTLSYSGRDGSYEPGVRPNPSATNWSLAAKFFDYLEANSGDYWVAPELTDDVVDPDKDADISPWENTSGDTENSDSGLFASAYGEDFVYQDSTNDGIEGPLFESPFEDDTHFDHEAERIASRLLFLYRVAGLWKTACMACMVARQLEQESPAGPLSDRFEGWIKVSTEMRRGMQKLVTQLRHWKLPAITEDYESLSRYDHRRAVRDSLLEQTVATITALREAELLLRSCGPVSTGADRDTDSEGFPKREAIRCLRAIFSARTSRNPSRNADVPLQQLLKALRGKHLIHIAIHRGGSCRQSVTAHTAHAFLRTLVWHLPRLGQVGSACRLLETLRRREGRAMGRAHTISHFNRLFELACRSIFETTARAAAASNEYTAQELCQKIEVVAETLLISWVRYSRSLRLSVVERFMSRPDWDQARQFIEKYGHDLFTKDKLDLGVLRGILYQGSQTWFAQISKNVPEEDLPTVLREIKNPEELRAVSRTMNGILEALAENFDEYTEFHATTSKADRGELTYVLLDFLRLRCEYRRVAWNLWPFVLAHSAIVNQGLEQVASLWEKKLADRVRERADHFLARLNAMEDKYSVALPSIREAIREQFVHPMQINYLLGDTRTAMDPAHKDVAEPAFTRLELACEKLISNVTGAHRTMPEWLDRMARLVQPSDAHASADLAVSDVGNMPDTPPPSLEQIVSQVLAWRKNAQGFTPLDDT